MLYIDVKNGIKLDVFENNDYLIIIDGQSRIISNDSPLLIGLLPLLQADLWKIKSAVEELGLNFFEIIPIEKLILSAFEKDLVIQFFGKNLL